MRGAWAETEEWAAYTPASGYSLDGARLWISAAHSALFYVAAKYVVVTHLLYSTAGSLFIICWGRRLECHQQRHIIYLFIFLCLQTSVQLGSSLPFPCINKSHLALLYTPPPATFTLLRLLGARLTFDARRQRVAAVDVVEMWRRGRRSSCAVQCLITLLEFEEAI